MSNDTATTSTNDSQYNPERVEELKRRIAAIERTTWDTSKSQKFRDALAKEYAKPGNPNPDAVVEGPKKYNANTYEANKNDDNDEKKKTASCWSGIFGSCK